MKRTIFGLFCATALVASTGCGNGSGLFPVHQNAGCGASACGDGSGGMGGGNGMAGGAGGMAGDGSGMAGAGMAGGGYGGNGACGDLAGCGHCDLPRGVGGCNVGAAGPATGAVAYPYYSNRGPRDFLVNNPPSIGP